MPLRPCLEIGVIEQPHGPLDGRRREVRVPRGGLQVRVTRQLLDGARGRSASHRWRSHRRAGESHPARALSKPGWDEIPRGARGPASRPPPRAR